MLGDNLEEWDKGGVGGRKLQEGGDVCIQIADSLQCTAETNIIKQLNSNNKYINAHENRALDSML